MDASYICNVTKSSYKKILILIVVSAAALIVAQGYFTYQSYKSNKQRFIADVNQALNESIENYFADKAKSEIYILTDESPDTVYGGKQKILKSFDNLDSLIKEAGDSVSIKSTYGFSHAWSGKTTTKSIPIDIDSMINIRIDTDDSIKVIKKFDKLDVIQSKEFEFLTQKVMVSIGEQLLDIGKVYSKLDTLLAARNLDIDFRLSQFVGGRKTSIGTLTDKNFITEEATSGLLGSQHSIVIDFENATLLILRNGVKELIISLLLVGLVVGTMLYLYRTIYHQKQLAEIKDDLISNITHEFKTPIATIFSALEGVTNFNQNNDPEKTKRYIDLSNNQLRKLNDMVEKMLETAIIDQGKLTLNKEEVEVAEWTNGIVSRFSMVETEKKISYESAVQSHIAVFDRFHVENALSNLLDNAIKYGGNQITLRLVLRADKLAWEVQDNGGNIPKSQQDKIFDKLYRVPTGNQHDIKGFGIGLYYAKTIAELHEGTLDLKVAEQKTLFTLTI